MALERNEWIRQFEASASGKEALALLQGLRTPGREREFDYAFMPMTLTACYEAKRFSEKINKDGDPNQNKRQLDADFLNPTEIEQQIAAAKKIRRFIVSHWKSPAYQVSRPLFYFKMRDNHNLIMTNRENGKSMDALFGLDLALQAYVDTLEDIHLTPIKLSHHQIYGCLMYNKSPNSDNPDVTTKLAFNLQLYFRYFSLGEFGTVCLGAGLPMPQDRKSKPCHNIVASLVSATFEMESPWDQNNAQKNVANLIKQHPDILFTGWPNP